MDIKCFFRKLSYTNLMIECFDPVGLGRLRVSESDPHLSWGFFVVRIKCPHESLQPVLKMRRARIRKAEGQTFQDSHQFFLESLLCAQPSGRPLKIGLTLWGGDKLWRPTRSPWWPGCVFPWQL